MSDIPKPEELLIANLILPIIKDLILPKVQSLLNKNSDVELNIESIESNFEEYLTKRYERYTVIETLVFPNKQTEFDKLYEPLTLIAQQNQNKEVIIKIDNYPETLLPTYYRVIIEDTAGMGKSTIVKKLFRSIIEQKSGFPILIELRHINEENTFIKEIQNQLTPIGKDINQNAIYSILNEGGFIFLFDGFDEIALKDREFVIKSLHNLIEKANHNYFLITSRPEESLTSFSGFEKFQIKSLTKDEAYNLIRKYDKYSFRPIAEDLINLLDNNNEKVLEEFLENPLLVSLLYKSYEYKKDIPIKKSQFYRQVFDALFEAHDLSKEGYLKREKYSNLHTDDFERVLRYIGYLTAIENKVEYDRNYIINIIEKVKKFLPDLAFKASDFLKDLLKTVPLFKKEGNDVKWAHKSLQDYFAAKFIWVDAKDNQEIILKKIYHDKKNIRFINLLDLFYEIDTLTFEKFILYWLLKDYYEYSNNNYNKEYKISKDAIEERKSLTFGRKHIISLIKSDVFDIEATKINKKNIASGIRRKMFQDGYDMLFELYHNEMTGAYYISIRNTACEFFVASVDERNKSGILQLIVKKDQTLALHENIPNININEDYNLLDHFDMEKVYSLDDDPENILNRPELFLIINEALKRRICLNHKNALKKLNEIEEIRSEKIDNELINW